MAAPIRGHRQMALSLLVLRDDLESYLGRTQRVMSPSGTDSLAGMAGARGYARSEPSALVLRTSSAVAQPRRAVMTEKTMFSSPLTE
jgi:hypothetical protein